jgi:hypothetical protein
MITFSASRQVEVMLAMVSPMDQKPTLNAFSSVIGERGRADQLHSADLSLVDEIQSEPVNRGY